jgi:hypothetical protein
MYGCAWTVVALHFLFVNSAKLEAGKEEIYL